MGWSRVNDGARMPELDSLRLVEDRSISELNWRMVTSPCLISFVIQQRGTAKECGKSERTLVSLLSPYGEQLSPQCPATY